MIVVDASAVLEVLLRTARAASAEARMLRGGETLHAPHLIDVEVAQVLRRYAAWGEVRAERCRTALGDFLDFPIIRYPHDILLPRLWELRAKLTASDAVYVALAETLDAPIITGDTRLARATGHAARIDLV